MVPTVPAAATAAATDDLSQRLGLQRDGTIIDRLAALGYERRSAALAMAALTLPLLTYTEHDLSEAVVYLETAEGLEISETEQAVALTAAQETAQAATRLVAAQHAQAQLEQHHLGWSLLEIDLNALSLQIRSAEAAGVDTVAPEALRDARVRSSLTLCSPCAPWPCARPAGSHALHPHRPCRSGSARPPRRRCGATRQSCSCRMLLRTRVSLTSEGQSRRRRAMG